MHYAQIRQRPAARAIFSAAEQRHLDTRLDALNQLPEKGSPTAGVATLVGPLSRSRFLERRELAAAIPGSTLREVNYGAHAFTAVTPDLFNTMLLQFLADVDG